MPACKRFLAAVFLSTFSFGAFCQMEMPTISNISISDGPAMPRITAPTLGTRYYTPGNVYTNISSKNSGAEIKNSEKTETVSTESKEKKLEAIFGTANARLTASDVAGLGNDGLFGGIYGLLGKDASLYTSKEAAASQNEVLLKTIMGQLDELKKENKALNQNLAKKNNLPVTHSTSSEPHEFEPSILRFYVNGCNILDTMRTVYFSKKENDGSFLLTGDRRYTSDNKNREETFYLLFRADGNCGTSAGYYVEPQVIQDYKNEYSFLYQLSRKPELKAEKTGNLVSVKYVSADWNMDLLLDIGDM